MRRALPALALAVVACSDGTQGVKTLPRVGVSRDARVPADGGQPEAGAADARGLDLDPEGDAASADGGTRDADDADGTVGRDGAIEDGPRSDLPEPDVAPPDPDMALPDPDMAPPDPDMAPPDPDMAPPEPDMAPPDPDMAGVPPGRTPCSRGAGWTLFSFHWRGDGSTSAAVDVWDAPCDYSIRINDACGVFARCRGAIPCAVDLVDNGRAVVIDGAEDILVRFSVVGVAFQRATVHIQGRSLGGATFFSATNPLHGGVQGGPVAGGLDHQWYALDWTGFVLSNDDPGLTGLDLDAVNGRLGISAVELCLE